MEDGKLTGTFPMDIGGPVRPLVLDEDAGHHKATPAQRRQLVALIVLVVLVIALVISLVVIVIKYENIDGAFAICETEDCIRSADNLIQSMEPSVDPCQDFYRFACGRWSEDHPLPDAAYSNDWFSETSTLINQQIQDYLETNQSSGDSEAESQARRLYSSCMDTELLDDLSLAPMVRFLRTLGLADPLADPLAPPRPSLNWLLARAQRSLGLDVLVGFVVAPKATERALNRMTVSAPSSEPVLPGYPEVVPSSHVAPRSRRASGTEKTGMLETQYVAHVMELVQHWNDSGVGGFPGREPRVMEAADRVQRLTQELAKARPDHSRARLLTEPEEMTVAQLQKAMDVAAGGRSQINWSEYLHVLFDHVEGVTLQLSDGDVILVYDMDYLRQLSVILSSVDNTTLHTYLWWQVVHTLSPYTNSEMRLLKERFLEDATEAYSPQSRPHFCAQVVNQLMGMAVARFFYEPQAVNGTRDKVLTMVADIRSAFDDMVSAAAWMDDHTKEETRRKAADMTFLVGFPDWLQDKEAVARLYRGITIAEDTFLDNLISIAGHAVNTSLATLRTVNERGRWDESPPMEPNAVHIPDENLVVIPAGILQFPFYLLGLEALNYGALGTIVGHELTHGFDDQGRRFDRDGNIRQWWSNATVSEYVNRTACFSCQYSQYTLPDSNATVDGELTLGENIADNGGLSQAFRAYRKFRGRHGPEPKLPGLEKYTDEQLFFLAFANVWCEKWTKQSLRNDLVDEHAPKPIRVTGVITNSAEFSRVWQCGDRSPGNKDSERCVLW